MFHDKLPTDHKILDHLGFKLKVWNIYTVTPTQNQISKLIVDNILWA
jgi:hypothetical protein